MSAAAPPAAEETFPHPSEFDTKGSFRWSMFLLLVGMHLGALAVLATRILPWLTPRIVPGLHRLLTGNPLITLEGVATNKLLILSVVCLVGPIVGVTVGFHRGETHRAFKWDKPRQIPVRVLFLTLGHMAFQGDLITWAARHKPHHTYTDTKADSHSPMRYTRTNRRGVAIPSAKGFGWAHIGTYFYGHLLPPPPYPNRKRAWKTTQVERYEFWVGNMERVPLLRVLRRLFVPLTVVRFGIPFAVAGWDGLLIAGLFTAVLMLNITWCTNSVAHMWGTFFDDTKSLKIAGTSRNVFAWMLLWFLSLGEAWHFLHHRLETCAAHGWKWYQFDLSKYIIGLLEILGLVYDVKWHRRQRAGILAEGHISRRPVALPVLSDR
jgi:stearoyl-CoA desaturase (Delta-9 desaturase)